MVYSDNLYAISYDNFKKFVAKVCKDTEVIGPKKEKTASNFGKIAKYDDLVLNKITDFPLKYTFFSDKEVFFEFDGNDLNVPSLKPKEKVILGARRCDLKSVQRQDKAFNYKFTDEYYNARREKTIFIGIHCKGGMDEYCFCESLKDEWFFDLMLYPRHDHYLVEMGTEKGKNFIDKYREFFNKSEYKLKAEDRLMNTDRLKNPNIKPLFANPKWEELSKKCISCGACNLMCPSCYCFDILDELNFDFKSGKRIRRPASCQMRCFTRLAGEGHFRDKKIERYKHRIYHQLLHFKERHDITLCSGCGRCIRHCPNKIEFVNAINEMK